MERAIRHLVEAESPTHDLAAVRRCATLVAELGTDVTGVSPEVIEVGGRPHLTWCLGPSPRVGLLGHFDTVWPVGTLAARPYREEGREAFGPGIFDMKCGVVQAFFATAAAGPDAGVEILLTSDEETGSGTSRGLVEEMSRAWTAALVLEASQDGALKVGRKGVSTYDLTVAGRAAHAGLEPERGANALVELAHVVIAATRMANSAAGTSVSPTVAHAGIAGNVIPPGATLHLDVRAFSGGEQERVDEALRTLAMTTPGTSVRVDGGVNRPPMSPESGAGLFDTAVRLYQQLGLGDLRGVTVGGASDGNFTAGVGTPTLDGLGAVGGGAHALDEHVLVAELAPRTALLAALIGDLLIEPLTADAGLPRPPTTIGTP